MSSPSSGTQEIKRKALSTLKPLVTIVRGASSGHIYSQELSIFRPSKTDFLFKNMFLGSGE